MSVRESIEVIYKGWTEGGRKFPWLLELIFDLPYALDLTDDMGRPTHDKMIPTFVSMALIVYLFLHPEPTWKALIMMIVLGAYVYGYSAWRSVSKAASELLSQKIHAAKVVAITNRQEEVADAAILRQEILADDASGIER